MSIKQHFEAALAAIQGERERAVAVARDRITREKITPHNQEVDKSMNEAIVEITKQRDVAIANVQAKFNEDRQSLIDEGARQKNTFAERAIAAEIAVIDAQYDEAIRVTLEQIQKYTEE